jgi:hypothetical protein
MVQLRKWRPNNLIAALTQAETQIDVVVGDREMLLVEPSNFLIECTSKGKTCASASRQLASERELAKIAGIVSCSSLAKMPRYAVMRANPQYDTRVLDCIVGIEQLGSDCSDCGSHYMGNHFLEPICADDNCVVVEQYDDFARRLLNCVVIYG